MKTREGKKMATPKKKTKTPLHFDVPTTTPERTYVLFTWGDKEFKTYESQDISPIIMTNTLEMLTDDPFNAMIYALKETFGEEQYREFTKLQLSPEAFKAITTEVMQHLASGLLEEEVDQGKA